MQKLKGIPVLAIIPGSLADRAGVLVGDRILSVNGRECNDYEDYIEAKELKKIMEIIVKRGEILLELELKNRDYEDKTYWT